MVIITAYGSVPDAVLAMKLGAVDFLAKPITPEALRMTVADVLARHTPTKKISQDKVAVDPAADNLREAKRELNLREFDKADQLLTKALAANPGRLRHITSGECSASCATRSTRPMEPTGLRCRPIPASSPPGSIS